jgi:hypothetical protein
MELALGAAVTTTSVVALAAVPSARCTSARRRTVPLAAGSNDTVGLLDASKVTAGPLTWVQLTSASPPLQASAVAPAALPASMVASATMLAVEQPAGGGAGAGAGLLPPEDPPPPHAASSVLNNTTPENRRDNSEKFKIDSRPG